MKSSTKQSQLSLRVERVFLATLVKEKEKMEKEIGLKLSLSTFIIWVLENYLDSKKP